MTRYFLAVVVVGLALVVVSAATGAATPKEAVGFFGTVTGKVKSTQPDGTSFVLTVSKAEADPKTSAVKNTAPMVGKELSLGTRMPRKDGKPTPHEEDVAYVKSLKAGDLITIKVFAVRSAPEVLRMQGPGAAATTSPS